MIDETLGQAVLQLRMTIDPGFEEEYERWHVQRYIPRMLELPGFLAARRYTGLTSATNRGGKATDVDGWVDGHQRWLTLFDLADEGAAAGDAFEEADRAARRSGESLQPHVREVTSLFRLVLPEVGSVTRSGLEGEGLNGAFALHVMTDAQEGWEDQVDDWYLMEHFPEKLDLSGYLSARRFKRVRVLADATCEEASRNSSLAIYELRDEGTLEEQSVPGPLSPIIASHMTWFRTIYRQTYPL
jgi:hypothetical protein